MNVPFNSPPQGWQCPCCKTIYAPSVFSCAPCSMGHAPRLQPTIVPSVWEPAGTPVWINPQPTTCGTAAWNGPINPDGSPAPLGEFKGVVQC